MSSSQQQFDRAADAKPTFESGNWHDASELSRKDAISTDARPTQETIIAEKTLNPNYVGPAAPAPAERVEEAKEAVKETAEEAKEQAAGFAAAAQQKAGELAHKASEIMHQAYDKAADLAPALPPSIGAIKETIVNTAGGAYEKAADAFHATTEKAADALHTVQHKAAELTGLAAPDLKDALANIKEPAPETEMPKSPLSEISAAELLLQKATMTYNADLSKVTDSSLPLGQRAAAAADAVAQKATIVYEKGVIAASNMMSKTSAEPATPAPPAQASQ
jgi:hypothetical protein